MLYLYILTALFAAIILLLFTAAIRAALIKRELPDDKPFSPERDGINPDTNIKHLSQILSVPDVSIRGSSDKSRIYEMHRLLEKLYPKLHSCCEITDLDGALLWRWRGKSDSEPILLMSHHDVVEAQGEWRHDAFGGEVEDGIIWGRGAVDTKGALCAILEAVEALVIEGFVPAEDVYIASSCNEEITGNGAVKTADYLEAQGIRLALVMDEGGYVLAENTDDRLKARKAMIGIMEKGRSNMLFTAESSGGHASVPFSPNPFGQLAAVVNAVERRPFKKRLTKPAMLQYKAMAPYMKHFRHRFLYGNLWLFRPIAPYIMSRQGGAAAAAVGTTCVFTMAQGSKGANVIPQKATMTANCRFMPHEPLEASYSRLKRIAGRYNVTVERLTGLDVLPAADTDSLAYKYVRRSIAHSFGDIPQLPYIMLAGTDSRHYAKICSCVLRFVPLMFTKGQLNSAHGIDENINVEALTRAVRFYYDFIKGYGNERLSS